LLMLCSNRCLKNIHLNKYKKFQRVISQLNREWAKKLLTKKVKAIYGKENIF